MKFLTFALLIFLQTSTAFSFIQREHAMGETCYFIRQKTSISLCQPANVAREDHQFFFGQFLFSEGINQADNWKKVIEEKASADEIISLVEDNRRSYITNETRIGYVGNSWAMTYKPYELWVETRIQNPSYPFARIDAGMAQVLGLDFGHYLNEELSIGIKIEAARVQTVKEDFFLADLALEPKVVDLKPVKKERLVVSPGLAFEPENAWGNARYSLLLEQSYLDTSSVLYSGVSFLNEFYLGKLEWGLGTQFQESVPVRPQVFTYYQIGMTTLTTSLSPREQTYGAFLALRGVEAGLSYFIKKDDRVLFLQFGFNL